MADIEGRPQSIPIEVSGGFGRTLASETAPPPVIAREITLIIPPDSAQNTLTYEADAGAIEVFGSANVDQIKIDPPPVLNPEFGLSVENDADAVQEGVEIPMQEHLEVSFGSRANPHFQLKMRLFDGPAPTVYKPRPISREYGGFRKRSGRWDSRQRISRTSGRKIN